MRLVSGGRPPGSHHCFARLLVLGGAVLAGVLALSWSGELSAAPQDEDPGPPSRTVQQIRAEDLINTGRESYNIYCSGCHGVDGDGKGPAAEFLDPRPRDFREAVYKFRTTPSGALPTDADLHRTLSQGVLGTSMPSWYLIPENTKLAMIEYLKTFSDAWKEDWNYEPAIAVPGAPDFMGDDDSIERGLELYAQMKCAECHGQTGKGDGPASATLVDDWGVPIVAFDFSSGSLKGGTTAEDVYRTFSTGLNGTPMPSYGDILSPEDRWHLVSYILSLRQQGSGKSKS